MAKKPWKIEDAGGGLTQIINHQGKILALTNNPEMAKKIAAIPVAHAFIDELAHTLGSFPASEEDFIPDYWRKLAESKGEEYTE